MPKKTITTTVKPVTTGKKSVMTTKKVVATTKKAITTTKKPVTTTRKSTTATKPETTTVESPFGTTARFADEILRLTNIERVNNGLAPLGRAPAGLWSAAQVRAQEASQSFSHTRPDGRKWSSVLDDFSVSFMGAGENLQWATNNSPKLAVDQWMGSSAHRANILNAQFKELAVGVYGTACVQLFLMRP
jgi:uncharacterized protein YkwD